MADLRDDNLTAPGFTGVAPYIRSNGDGKTWYQVYLDGRVVGLWSKQRWANQDLRRKKHEAARKGR